MPQHFLRNENRAVWIWSAAKVVMALILMHQIFIPLADATQFVSGGRYVFTAQSPPIGQKYNYLWEATDGFPLTSINESFIWTSPKVSEPTTVKISLQESSIPNGCTAESKLSILVLPQSSPLVVTKTADKAAVLVGKTVNFTISVTNNGKVDVDSVRLVDILSPGFIYRSAQPEPDVIDGNKFTWNLGTFESQKSVQVVLEAQVDPSLCPNNYAQTTEGVIANINTQNQLNVLAASRESSNLAQIMEALGRNKTKLEVKLDNIRTHRDAFNRTLAAMSSTVKIIDGAKYTLNNYTDVLTGESLSDQFNASGVLVATEFARPAKDDLMRTEYSATGEILSDFYNFKPTKESLKIEYNIPSIGYKTYTVRYLPTGDTLIMMVDSYGNVVSREYEKRPGLRIIAGPLTNCVKAYGMLNGMPIESNEACVQVIWSCQDPQPVSGLKVTKVVSGQCVDGMKFTVNITGPGGYTSSHDFYCLGGDYTFTNLPTGSYTITETPIVGWSTTITGSPATVRTGQTVEATVTNTKFNPGSDFKISGIKFNDINGNGIQDTDESGIADWKIYLQLVDGQFSQSVTTGRDGSFIFENLPQAGIYHVWEDLSEHLTWTPITPAGGSTSVTLTGDQPTQTVDFGNRQKIVPELECVRINPDSSYTAKFTYNNPNGEITIAMGDNNRIEPAPLSGSQPDSFQSGIHSFTVVFDPSTPITWTLEGLQAVASTDSPSCNTGKPLVVTKSVDKTAVLAGNIVNFTFSVTNTGAVDVDNVQLVDTLSPGYIYQNARTEPNIIEGNKLTWNLGILKPQQSVQVVLEAQVDPSLCPNNNSQTSDGVLANQLNVLAASSESSNLPQIMDALGRNKTKLEVKLDNIRMHRDAFNKTQAAQSSSVKIIDGAKYTLNNYTDVLTGESLSDQFNASGVLVATEFARPAKDDLMRTEYSATGEILSDFYNFKPTKESLKIEYNESSIGYKTYTVRYIPTGDTLIMVVDSYGNVISKVYEKRPGIAIIEGPLTNCVKAYGIIGDTPIESNEVCVQVIWSCQEPQPIRGISLAKSADREVAVKNDVIKYTYTVKNTGSTTILTLTLRDDRLGLIMVNELVNLDPGGEITRTAYYKVNGTEGPILKNTAIAVGYDPAEIVSDPASAVVRIVSECLTKTAYPKVVKPGDYITYTINWTGGCGNIGDLVVDDYPSGVAFISASPSPDKGENTWILKTSPETITILVQVAQNIGNTSFDMGQGVTGTGFVNVHNDIRTKPVILRNKATLYYTGGSFSAYADVNVGKPSTYAGLREHGSGDYASEDLIKYRNLNRSIEWNKSLTATYKPTTFSLPGNRDLDYQTKWIEKAKTKNYATGGSTNEEYTYADKINREAYTKLDENGSTTITDTSFQGVGHIGLLKKDASNNKTWNATDVFESQEDYVGDFQIHQKFDEYGKNAEYEKSVIGNGYVSVDQKVGKAQRSYESGTGNYQSEERISTVVNYVAKDIKLEHAPTNYTYTPDVSVASDLKWSEGMWSKSPVTLISEKFSSAERLERDTKAVGLNEMDTEAKVVGQADFRTIYKDLDTSSGDKVDVDERYSGDFSFKRMTHLDGVAKYNRPHITLSKEAKVDLAVNTFADYRITIENDGDHTLGPVNVLDTFPQGTDYVFSSLRPSELTDGYANWTLLSLGIGSRVVIDLRLNIAQPSANIINRVQAAGMYNDGWVTAATFSAVQLNWLASFPTQIYASKMGWIDSNDSQVVWYRLDLHNRQRYNMVAFLMDQLPEGMTFLNSSMEPSQNNSNQMTWTIMNLAPGETKSIVYRVRALSKGIFVNMAHIDTYAVDGPDSASANVEARVDLTTGREAPPAVFDRWTLPACFGLNCTQQNFGSDWLACYTCGAGQPSNTSVIPPCLSCINTGDDNLP